MYKCGVIILFLFLSFAISCSSMPGNEISAHVKKVSIINLIATPEKYHRKNISVIGFAVLDFENTAVYLSEEDADRGITKNAIWLSIDDFMETMQPERIKEEYMRFYKGDYALIEGVFNAEGKGHFGGYSGTIEDVARFEHWWLLRDDDSWKKRVKEIEIDKHRSTDKGVKPLEN